MPPSKRRTSTGPASLKSKKAGSSVSQSTLAFHGNSAKVSKPSLTPHPAKAGFKKPSKPLSQDPSAPSTAEDIHLSDTSTATTEDVQPTEQLIASTKPSINKPEEDAARKVSEAQIKQYWRAKEDVRKAARVHQKDVSLHEKVCREFDTDSRFGPCVGIPRIRRWQRANTLGLKPAIEVLACLLSEQSESNLKSDRAYIDELLNSRFGE